jgi:tetratricopeptide (TPR) repeat protein
MADEENIDVSKPRQPPKAVQIGGDSIADRILPHIKKIVISIIVIAVILSGVFGYRAIKQSRQADKTEKLAAVLSLGQRKVKAPGAPQTQPEDKNNPPFADNAARAKALLDEAVKQGADLPHSYKGGLYLDAGQLDQAIAEYKAGSSADGFEGVLAREGYGIALETKALAEKDPKQRQALLEQALAAFAAMQPKADGPRRAYALYHQGRIQQTLGKTAEAKALYEQAKTAGASSNELAQLVEKRLAALGAS